MSKKSLPKVASYIWVGIIVLAIFAMSAMYFILPQRASSGSEELTSVPAFDVQRYLNGLFQTDFEQGLKDQFVLRDTAVYATIGAKAAVNRAGVVADNTLSGEEANAGLLPFGSVYSMNGTAWLTNRTYDHNAEWVAAYEKKAAEINQFAKDYPSVAFYVYYCTRAEDVPWFNELEGMPAFSYAELLDSLLDDSVTFGRKTFADFYEFRSHMYRTDHHWTNRGAKQGYEDILSLMRERLNVGSAREVVATNDFDGLIWLGSRWRECGMTVNVEDMDRFEVYTYALPEYKEYFGEREQAIGLAEDYMEGRVVRDVTFDQYLNYYGFESEPIRLEFGSNSGTNLLIIGDSYARAVRPQLASHFDTTVYVNFRILGDVDIDAIMKDYQIGAVLFMGQQDAWSGYYLNRGDEQ